MIDAVLYERDEFDIGARKTGGLLDRLKRVVVRRRRFCVRKLSRAGSRRDENRIRRCAEAESLATDSLDSDRSRAFEALLRA